MKNVEGPVMGAPREVNRESCPDHFDVRPRRLRWVFAPLTRSLGATIAWAGEYYGDGGLRALLGWAAAWGNALGV